MNRQELNALLEKLHAELAASQQVDEALKQSLQALDQDIQRVLSSPGQATEVAAATTTAASSDAGDAPDITVLAQALEAKLEADHPYLVSTLRELMDRLGKMGI